MQDISPVLMAACGFCVVCGGVIVLGALVLLRFTGLGVLGVALPIISDFLNRDPVVDEGIDDTPRATPERYRSLNVRPKVDALDFDAAIDKYRRQNQQNPDPFSNAPPITPNTAPPPLAPPPERDDEEYPPLRRNRGRDQSNHPPVFYDDGEEGGGGGLGLDDIFGDE